MDITVNNRKLAFAGSLVAGESLPVCCVFPADVQIGKLVLLDNDREPVAACETWEGGAVQHTYVGRLNLATTQIADIVSGVQAGRGISFAAVILDENGNALAYGPASVIASAMPEELETLDLDLYLKTSDLRAAFADVPTTYSNQRAIASALGQVVEILQRFGLTLTTAIIALTAWDFIHAAPLQWQDVPAETVIGSGLSVTNGEIKVTGGGGGGGGTDENRVREIIADVLVTKNYDGGIATAEQMAETAQQTAESKAGQGWVSENFMHKGEALTKISVRDVPAGCEWYLAAANGIFTWYVSPTNIPPEVVSE